MPRARRIFWYIGLPPEFVKLKTRLLTKANLVV